METIIRNVGELTNEARSAAENLVGHGLSTDQRLVIMIQPSVEQGSVEVDQIVTADALLSRPFGLCVGKWTVPSDFDAPLPDELLDEFEGK